MDRSLVLKEFRATPGASRAREPAPKMNGASKSERVLLRSLLTDPEVRETLIVPLGASEVARTWPVWPVIRAVIDLANAGEAVTYPAVEAQLADETHRTLLSRAVFADSSQEVFSRDQARLYLGVLNSEDARLRAEALRARLKQAERSGDMDEALRLNAELTALQRTQSRRI